MPASKPDLPPYVVVTPARDEEEHLPGLLESLANQEHRPLRWVVVNDGSTDQTSSLAHRFSSEHDWVQVVDREDRGFRQAGNGVIDAVYAGLEVVGDTDGVYIVKLDADLTLRPDYFARCLQRFLDDPKLGIGGGLVCLEIDGKLVADSTIDPKFHVRGATKIYRPECWQGIGGLIRNPGWDTVDEVKANMLGWHTETFSDIPLIHQRPTGEAYGRWNDWVKGGKANYIAGYHPLFMIVKCLKRVPHKPFLLGATALFYGYLRALTTRTPRVPEKKVIRYFQQQQMRRLLFRSSLWSR